MSLKRILVSSLIGFTIISLGLVIGYFLDPRPLSDYEDIALYSRGAKKTPDFNQGMNSRKPRPQSINK